MFALVSECMKNRLILEEIATGCPKSFLRDDAIQQDVEVAIVLLYEYLLGRKFGRAVGLRVRLRDATKLERNLLFTRSLF